MNPWIFVGLLVMAAGAGAGWWLNCHPVPLSADPIGIVLDDLDDVCHSVGVLCDDSRDMARWCDQSSIDRIFLGMVDTPAMQAIDHYRIPPATPDEEN